MRISDWSSDVCSSDLQNSGHFNQCFSAFVLGAASLVCKQFGSTGPVNAVGVEQVFLRVGCQRYFYHQQIASECGRSLPFAAAHEKTIGIHEIGRGSWRESMVQSV